MLVKPLQLTQKILLCLVSLFFFGPNRGHYDGCVGFKTFKRRLLWAHWTDGNQIGSLKKCCVSWVVSGYTNVIVGFVLPLLTRKKALHSFCMKLQHNWIDSRPESTVAVRLWPATLKILPFLSMRVATWPGTRTSLSKTSWPATEIEPGTKPL